MRIHGKNWAKIAEFVGTRDQQQCRSHRQKFVQRIKADPTIVGADLLQIMIKIDEKNYWTEHEHKKFIKAVRIHGKNWSKIAQYVVTRNYSGCQSHGHQFV